MQGLAGIEPLPRVGGDHAAGGVHAYLRRLILDATIPPNTTITQVELASLLGVSRTPIREAIRMLQEEGLVVAEPQKRARVIGFNPEEVEAIYTQRVLLESLAAKMTATAISPEALEQLETLLDQMHGTSQKRDLQSWEQVHRAFHLALVAHAGDRLVTIVTSHIDRTELYRRVFWEDVPRAWHVGAGEHQSIVDAYRERDGRRAASEVASHLARTGLTLIVNLAPQADPLALRSALELVDPGRHITRSDSRASIPRRSQRPSDGVERRAAVSS